MSQPAPPMDRQILERIELALPEWLPGCEVLERNLEFDHRPLAHWLVVGSGRALFISAVEGAEDSTVLCALDGLAFIHSQPELLGAMLGDRDVEELQIGLVLVALDDFSKLQLERLSCVPALNVELLRRRELRSQRGTHTRLESIDHSEAAPAAEQVELPDWSLEMSFRPFLARVAPDRLQLALDIIERIRRMDPQFDWCMDGEDLSCQFNGASLARLQWEAGCLGLFFDEPQSLVPIRDSLGLELALETLLDVYLEVLSGGKSKEHRGALEADHSASEWDLPMVPVELEPMDGFHEPRGPLGTPRPIIETLDPLELSEEPDLEVLDELEDLDEVEILPLPPGPLLTRDEIEAFLE